MYRLTNVVMVAASRAFMSITSDSFATVSSRTLAVISVVDLYVTYILETGNCGQSSLQNTTLFL